jgi:hypothetical protein
VVLQIFSDLQGIGYNRSMAILDNLESAWENEFEFEHQNLAVKIFSDTCCNGCSCVKESDHKSENY